MPPNGFNSVSIDDDTAERLDAIVTAVDDCDSRADAIARAADAFDVSGGGGG